MRCKLIFSALLGTSMPYLGHCCHLHHGLENDLDFHSIAAQNRLARSENIIEPRVSRKLAINNVRVFDGMKIRDPCTVIIEGAFIGNDSTNAEHIDANGSILLPGLIDAHCHPSNLTHLNDLAKHGVTTGLVMACYASALCTSLQDHRGLPDIRYASAPAAALGSTHGNLTSMIDPTLVISNISQVPSWIDRQLVSDPDYIKIIAQNPGLDQETLGLLVQESHRYGKLAVCHASDIGSYEQAINSRVDHIHHAPLDKPLTSEMVLKISSYGQVVTPTLTMMRAIAENEPHTRNFQAAMETVRKLHKAGARVLVGTDANLQPAVPAQVQFGRSMHDELDNLVAAGMTNLEALNSATSHAAKYFGLHDRGRIAPGMRADLIMLRNDPLQDIKAIRDIEKIWIGGVEVPVQQ